MMNEQEDIELAEKTNLIDSDNKQNVSDNNNDAIIFIKFLINETKKINVGDCLENFIRKYYWCISLFISILFIIEIYWFLEMVILLDKGVFTYDMFSDDRTSLTRTYKYNENLDSCAIYNGIGEECVFYVRKNKVEILVILLMLFSIYATVLLFIFIIFYYELYNFNFTKYIGRETFNGGFFLSIFSICNAIVGYFLGITYSTFLYDINKTFLMNNNVFIYGGRIPNYFVGKINNCENVDVGLRKCKIPMHIFLRTMNYMIYGIVITNLIIFVSLIVKYVCAEIWLEVVLPCINYLKSLPEKYEEFKNTNKK